MSTFILLKLNFVIFHQINLFFILTLLPWRRLFRCRYYALKWIESDSFCLSNKILWFLSYGATKYTMLIILWNRWPTHWHSFCLLNIDFLFSFLLYFFVSQCLYIFFHFFESFLRKINFRIPSCLNYSVTY
jgi:hypothetical protein